MPEKKDPMAIWERAGKQYKERLKGLKRSTTEDRAVRPLFGRELTPNEQRQLAAPFIRNPAAVMAIHERYLSEDKDRPPGTVSRDFWAGLDRKFALLKEEEEIEGMAPAE